MLREVWRLQRDQFWVAEHVRRRLGRSLSPATSRSSTASRRAPSSRISSGKCRASSARRTPTKSAATTDARRQVALGYLAADLRLVDADGSYEITRIVTGDAWDAGADSPLNAVGVEAKAGERIVAVNGQPTSPRALTAGVARASGRDQGRADARHVNRRAAVDSQCAGDDARRRSPRALPRMGRTQPTLGPRAIAADASAISICPT